MNTYDELQKEMTLTFDAPISFEKKKAPEQVTELDDSVLTSEERQAVHRSYSTAWAGVNAYLLKIFSQ